MVLVSFSHGNDDRLFNFETQKNKNPIGIFDSGVGGLTVLKAVSKCALGRDIVYFGDTKRVPYGQRSKDEIVRYALQAINFLRSKKVDIILIACGTVTSYISDIKNAVNEEIPIFGIIESACHGAVKVSQNGRIGVICTPVSANVGLYEKTILNINPEYKVYTLGCPVLAPLIEKGITDNNYDQINTAVKFYVDSLKKNNVDTIILGCTHYPIVKNIIKKYAGNDISLVEPGEELAKFMEKEFKKFELKDESIHNRNIQFFVSGDVQKFKRDVENILKFDYTPNVGQVDIESY